MFGVANLREAEELRAGGITDPVLLLSTCLPGEHEAVLRQGFQLFISTAEEAATLDALASTLGTKARAHIMLDTGMGRIGFPAGSWNQEAITSLLALRNIAWEGIGSHLPSPDDDADYTRDQIARFAQGVALARDAGLTPQWVHVASGAGLLGYPEQNAVCNLVRPGLMLYGVSPLPGKQPLLKPALTWKTRIALIRELPAGHGISYGRTEILKRVTRVATLACGYADGYPRQVSGKGAEVLVRGVRCPLIGRVTMDQMMVDVTDMADAAQVGDEVVLLGAQGQGCITAMEVAQKAGTIAWHVFTGITGRVQRCYAS